MRNVSATDAHIAASVARSVMVEQFSTSSAGHRYSSAIATFDHSSPIETQRLELVALRVADAEEMVVVLADPALHEFTGGRPASLEELRGRYTSWAGGSGSVDELWLNWIVRRRIDNAAIGAVRAAFFQARAQRVPPSLLLQKPPSSPA